MKIFVCDNLFNNSNITGYNSLLLNDVLQTSKDDCIVFFLEDVEKNYKIYDYLNEKHQFNHYFWCENLKQLFEYNIIVTSRELLNDELLFYNKSNIIYYFCEKKNINFNEKFNNREKYLFLADYDRINELDKRFFTKIYTFNNCFVDNNKVEFIRFNLKRNDIASLFDNNTKENIKINLEIKKDFIVIFIHLFDNLFYDTLDRIILSIYELKKTHKIYPIFYWPLDKEIEKTITKKDIILYNEKMYYKFYNLDIPIDIKNIEDIINNDDIETYNIKFSINKEFSLTIKDYILNVLNKYLNDEYTLITKIDDYNLLQHIYMSDIYIPITEKLSYLTLLSQYYKTYTIFTNDSNNTQEYCIFGDIPLLNSNDYIHCAITNRIKRNLRVEDMKNSIENYIKNKENPFFLYKREFCEYLFG
jgi:hypothetical protein